MQDSKSGYPDISNKGNGFDDINCLWTVGIDSKGRQSLAFQYKKTGQLTTWSDHMARSSPDGGSEVLRRCDADLCWLLSEDWSPGLLRSTAMLLRIPILLMRAFLDLGRSQWNKITTVHGPDIVSLPWRLTVFAWKMLLLPVFLVRDCFWVMAYSEGQRGEQTSTSSN